MKQALEDEVVTSRTEKEFLSSPMHGIVETLENIINVSVGSENTTYEDSRKAEINGQELHV